MRRKRHQIYLVKDVVKPVDTAIHEKFTVQKALDELRKKVVRHRIIYFYVVDDDNRLLGIVPTRKLLLSPPDVKIADIMDTAIVCLSHDQTSQGAMELFNRYGLLALPVTDDEGKLLGIIDVDMFIEESCDIANAKHRLDIFQIIGLTLEDEQKASLWKGYRLRMPWILCNLFGGLACAVISSINEVVLSKIILLAMFIPLVLTLSESISMQAMTCSLQFLHRTRMAFKLILLKVFREWRITVFMAVSSGIFVGLISLLWGQGVMPSVTIGSGIMISVTISASFGIIIPLTLHYLRLDPKVASGPVVLMLADILTTAMYLGLASAWLL